MMGKYSCDGKYYAFYGSETWMSRKSVECK